MSSSSSPLISCNSETKDSSVYSRKEKSLGLLCSNFLKMYDAAGVEFVELDNAATQLGIERRRIYDIVNILESVGVLIRKAKNKYTWKGYAAIPRTLEILKESGLQEKFKASIQCNKLSGDNNKQLLNSKTGESKQNSEPQKVDGRKEKSLMLLAQNFVKLFICSDEEIISVDQVTSTLLGDIRDPTSMKSKLRRVYDITNVFVSINLIDKVRDPASGKPALKWIGGQGLCKLGSSIAPNVRQPQKRVFGSDLTNTSSKRCKVDCSFEGKLTEKENVKKCALNQNIKYNNCHSDNSLKQDQKRTAKEFVFGPFKPSSVLKMEASKNKNAEELNFEKLPSLIQPRYQNQAITDLFAHYVESWKSWNDEAGGAMRKITDPHVPFTTHDASSN